MRQVQADELRHALRFEIQQVPRMTLANLQKAHPDIREPAIDAVVRRLMARMEKWEILVPDGLGHPAGHHQARE